MLENQNEILIIGKLPHGTETMKMVLIVKI